MHTPTSQGTWDFLIVCKDAGLHKTLVAAIQAYGGSTNYTSESLSALAYVTRRKLDGIFIDTRTEGALNLVGNIRRGTSNRFTVVFACAGEDEDVTRLLNAGANFIVHKPLDKSEIAAVLKSASQMMNSERQRYWRHQLNLPVVLKTPDKEQKAITSNISRGGMAVRCQISLKPGSTVQFVIGLPLAEAVQGRGEVAWSNTDGLMGIRFQMMGEQVKKSLWHWMEQHSGPSLS